jgi:NAD(P)-dependent dehydrogenase (short-subunit alcohol dehydrogenase family)
VFHSSTELRRHGVDWRVREQPAKIGTTEKQTGREAMRFTDKGVLVTGAASGIGEQVALAMAREGGVVAVADRDADGAGRVAEAVRQAGGRAHPFGLDVTDEAAVTAFVGAAATKLGRLDVLVNSAGVREIVSVLELPLAEWRRVIDINLTGTFLCSQAFARAVIERSAAGAIVNLASTLGVVAAPNRAAYTASKHAVVGLTKEMALELAEKGVRVNAVGPGVTRTAMTESYFANPILTQRVRAVHAMARWAEPSEIAKAILFLASDEASFCTGSVLMVDGGWTAGKVL